MSAQIPLADEFWLCAHDTVVRRAQLGSRPLGIGLAAALLTELVIWRCLTISSGRLYPVPGATLPDDPALAPVMSQLIEEERRNRSHRLDPTPAGQRARDWIAFLSADNRAADLVVARLSRTGLVSRQERRSLLGRPTVYYTPTDTNATGWPAVRISTALQKGRELSELDLVLAGLMLATGLHQRTLALLEQHELVRLAEQIKRRMHIMLREILHHAETAVGETVMTR
ncbi:GOLPH3/VPS74 family protein [Micromonospora zhanjiangensis]|uniref:GPP34 family phosphoprotein n=1 Tax=Micromonospora zhanjiangensis TaxID=1522057 RepID=A0ABV8KTE3_9ACTN